MANSTGVEEAGIKEELNGHEEGIFNSSASETDVEALNHYQNANQRADPCQKRLTLTFKDVTVSVKAPDQALGETLWSRVDPRQLSALFHNGDQQKRV